MSPTYLRRFGKAVAIFDLVDRYARDLRSRGRNPRPLGEVDLLVVARFTDSERRDFAPPLQMTLRRNPSGFDLFFGEVRPLRRRGRGFALDALFGAGRYAVRVHSRFYQPVELEIVLPEPTRPVRVELEPGDAYPFPRFGGATAPPPVDPLSMKEKHHA